ncbi:hypothetical protein [Marinobacter subterrani]|uniref:Uncharacterized protein n=1 Tax=Marinobacter subterrani TaxID=1658765 RepID=A0A0J7M7W2_9GAMM|nr:hypothetical protein [Marinobacter subterrani]KMQ73766.1 hypothetical protein Msub_20987 [Marinobacter subterrani]KMQ75351.1 hypothetical protein Msub_11553 [Marinobacter subterrani]KMQ76995.1 hypothetical protein Msub_13210 [Marinobacter subterrani]
MIKILKEPTYVDLARLSALLPFRTGPDEGVLCVRLLMVIFYARDIAGNASPENLAKYLKVDSRFCGRMTGLLRRHGMICIDDAGEDEGWPLRALNLEPTMEGISFVCDLKDKHGLFWVGDGTYYTIRG